MLHCERLHGRKACMGDWAQVGENLVRHKAWGIYLRAKVVGKVIRESLKTDDLRIAKIKRNARLAALRGAAVVSDGKTSAKTLGEVLAVLRNDLTLRPNIRPRT